MGDISGNRLAVWWVCVGCSWVLGVVCVHMGLVVVVVVDFGCGWGQILG